MKVWASILIAMILSLAALPPAGAALDRATLANAGFHVAPGAHLPLKASVFDDNRSTTLGRLLDGKPALLVFVDYRCRSLCGIVLDRIADVVPNVPLKLGTDYNVVALAIDDRQTPADAREFRDRHVGGTALASLGHFATEDETARAAIAASVGLVAPYDVDQARFAHPAGLVSVDETGRVNAVLSPFAVDPRDIELALTQSGAPSSFVGHVLQLCYGFNAATGVYDVQVERILAIAAAITIALMAAGLGTLVLVERRSARSQES